MDECVFCQIAQGKKPCHKIWENEQFLSFLSIFPNTEGFSLVIPKKHYPAYAFDVSDEILTKLILASKEVVRVLEEKLESVDKVAFILEGVGIDHLHAKLFPMHHTAEIKKWEPVIAHIDKYFDKYEGYVSSHDYVREEDKKLEKLARKIRGS